MLTITITNGEETCTATYNNYEEYTGTPYQNFKDYTKKSMFRWNIVDISTDEDEIEAYNYENMQLYDFENYCRKLIDRKRKYIEVKGVPSGEQMKIFCNFHKDTMERFNYDIDEICKYYTLCGCAMCEYRPNHYSGNSFIDGKNATIEITDEDNNIIKYTISKKKLFKEAIKFTLEQKNIEKLTNTPKSTILYSSVSNKIFLDFNPHVDIDKKQIKGQMNIFDYAGIA